MHEFGTAAVRDIAGACGTFQPTLRAACIGRGAHQRTIHDSAERVIGRYSGATSAFSRFVGASAQHLQPPACQLVGAAVRGARVCMGNHLNGFCESPTATEEVPAALREDTDIYAFADDKGRGYIAKVSGLLCYARLKGAI